MQVAIELPEDIAEGLRAKWKDLPRHTLEALALEASSAREMRAGQPEADVRGIQGERSGGP